ncbi:MAG TPA: hypothetical protein VHG29_00065 [Novosphingobium sp.]|nr:hypothetical protein [Novosphingobium sp.]
MLTVLTTLLLAGIALFAGGALVTTWRQYGTAALALGDQLRRADQLRAFDWTSRELTARRRPATIRQLPLRAPRPVLQPGLRAAA